ncbi:MAG: 2-oxoglutarate dehydrogenase E1 component, partial [Bacteroidetes bacterium]
KRFSLEGCESAIVALDTIINEAAANGGEEVVIGMAHRGRLNVLANIMGKTYAQIFNEFEGNISPDEADGDGDVKYHLGFSSQITATNGKSVYLKLAPNPSHLEAVGPVVTGFTRAKADNLYGNNYDAILPILIHGDAALAGQGVVYETIQMSKLAAYQVGGTIHVVINNQVGFTTDFTEARSSTYSTGVARVVDAPVFHVNGDDPEAVLYCCELALRYRQEFNSDVFIDIVGYRRYGHNEGDDPEFTQPEMYKNIKNHPNTRELYVQTLVQRGDLEKRLADEMEDAFRAHLQERLDEVRENKLDYTYQEVEQAWRQLKFTNRSEDFEQSPITGTTKDKVELILDKLVELPDDFQPIRKVKRLFKNLVQARASNAYDWGMGELLAYGTLLLEGHNVRMSGQDVRRGTFSHRHAVLNDAETYGKEYNRLAHLSKNQGEFRIFNSHLSEYAVLGFEYGYAMADPNDLVLWEAQFGDFCNGAQIVYDQFISAAESKWRRMNGLVCLLPHGYEGQGPEHSSARLERFLQLCAEFNMTVANVTQPANFFHLLRRQLARPFRKPLIVMTPKSLLRHPECVSPQEDFIGDTRFRELIDDPTVGPRSGAKIKRLLLCSGKIYFDLAAYKRENKRDEVAIVRLEQLYPLPAQQLNFIFKRYVKASDILWVQEEPSNMGAWQYIHAMRLNADVHLPRDLGYVSRKSSASPATGYKWVHDKEQQELVERAFT